MHIPLLLLNERSMTEEEEKIWRFSNIAKATAADARRAQLDDLLDTAEVMHHQCDDGYLALLRERYAGCAEDMAARLVQKVANDSDAVATMLLVFFACRRDCEMVGGMLTALGNVHGNVHESKLAALAEVSARRRDLATLMVVILRAAHRRPPRESELRDLRRFWRKEDEVDDVLRPARITAAADVLQALRVFGMPCPAAEAAAANDGDEGWAYNADRDEAAVGGEAAALM